MDEVVRRGYLRALGVTVWEPRFGLGPGGEEANPVDRTPAPDAAANPVQASASSQTSGVGETFGGADIPPASGRGARPPPGLDDQGVAQEPDDEGAMFEAYQSWARMGDDPMDDGLDEEKAEDVATMDWDRLMGAVAACRACGLCETRTQTVFGVGDRNADLLVIGEAPGADEDRLGEPFVGRAGQLLTPMLGAIGLSRDQVYITNVLKCRPPGNRDPKPEEIQRCEGYLRRQVALIRPRVILAVGRIAAQSLLRTDEPLGRLRGRWLTFGTASIPLRVTYHPAYLLRSPEQKAKAWEDLLEVRRRMTNISSV
ncbi:uracil-DNA glycosylase [Thiocystis violascens]|uniref:Type-4 uracil-DNA glycosylase n=1 Tax=Thiocystis violascens (strain ATCC 17096 / DSM 198 / 6111) TaxID=765911 RepID=I3YF48_THIV6|nr:uracil-DNA glycosylase [Thiocystis violascens]AFL75616.1 uracil-DNA glycosylase, family 4 [Thiocystis violascens DSM 198]